MVAEPAATALTAPAVPTVATPVLEDDHMPPAAASDRVTVLPTQADDKPAMVPALATAFTVTVLLVVATPQTFMLVYTMVSKPAVRPLIKP